MEWDIKEKRSWKLSLQCRLITKQQQFRDYENPSTVAATISKRKACFMKIVSSFYYLTKIQFEITAFFCTIFLM